MKDIVVLRVKTILLLFETNDPNFFFCLSGDAGSTEKTQLVIHGVEDQPPNSTKVAGHRFIPSLM